MGSIEAIQRPVDENANIAKYAALDMGSLPQDSRVVPPGDGGSSSTDVVVANGRQANAQKYSVCGPETKNLLDFTTCPTPAICAVSRNDPCTNEGRSAGEAGLRPSGRKRMVNLLSAVANLTWGLLNTIVGLVVAVPFVLMGRRVSWSSNGKQVNIDTLNLHMSLGLLHFGANAQHEGGHALQSAILGPAYLPLVGFAYGLAWLTTGDLSQAFIEKWATRLGERFP